MREIVFIAPVTVTVAGSHLRLMPKALEV
ncbi:hypothetical protein FP2506_18639 [Fulvimarina pelagi HTCC2506]|uniref:Uncharacterized protein n=1 Tax=Fulvimarina pelagi HTCC2506 TaxID=314231 RepID=Q0G0Q5_9HYPH|nr:hypothetical protein FP2506_18639 [Fulvimarina pelagi HTCC2506]